MAQRDIPPATTPQSKRFSIDSDHDALFIKTRAASFINGVEIPLDGGYSCHEPATSDLRAMAM
jgi:hypothetical protein